MRERHVTRHHYEAVERGEMTPEELKRRFREHALELCPVCDGELAAYLHGKRLEGLSLIALLALLRRIEGDIGRLEEEARQELAALLAMIPAERTARVRRARKRFRNPLLADLLIEKSRDCVFADPRQAADLARLAFDVALRIEVSLPGGGDLAHEPMTRAMAYEANALRAAGDLRAAEKSMASVLANLGKLQALLAQAEIVNLAASLRLDQRRLDEALRFADLAIRLYREVRDEHQVGQKMILKAQILNHMGQHEEAIQTITAALEHLDHRRDLRTYLSAEHTLTCYLTDAGHVVEARRRFEEAQGLYECFAEEPTIQLRRRWLEGKIARGLGELGHAERCLVDTRDGFLSHGSGYDAALAALDLALLYDEQERRDDLQNLADSLVSVFHAQDVHREALAALVLFVKAASRKAAHRPLIEALAAYLRQARHDHTLRFKPPS